MNNTQGRRFPSKTFWRWVKITLLLYCAAGIAIYYCQDRFLFHPEKTPPSTRYDFNGQPYTEIPLQYDQTTRLNLIEFKAAAGWNTDSGTTAPRGVVLFFHGNSRNVQGYAQDVPDFTRNGYEVWMMDYPGFGKSTGEFSEKKLYDYALILYKLARSRWQPSGIIIYGCSIGTGIAAELADVRDCRRLILESPFYSIESLAGYYLPVYPWGRILHYHFPIYTHLAAVTAPVTIFHGSADRTIPYGNASRLKPLLKPGDEFITIKDAGHNDLRRFPLFKEKLDSVLMR